MSGVARGLFQFYEYFVSCGLKRLQAEINAILKKNISLLTNYFKTSRQCLIVQRILIQFLMHELLMP